MRFRSRAIVWPVWLGVLCNPCVADEPGRGEKIFEAALVRVAEMNAARLGVFFTSGAKDPLESGSVEVRRKREVEVKLEGAAPSATYAVYFCSLGAAPTGCQFIGDLGTDRNGDGTARLPFGLGGAAWSGVFVLTREQANQFVSGFGFPGEAEETASATLQIHGRIALVTATGFRLERFPLDIQVTQETRFEKISGPADLKPGDEVDVWAYVRTDGAVVATRVRLDDQPGPPDHAVGKGR